MNAFGNALGNAAIAGIEHANDEQKEAQPNVFSMLAQDAQRDPRLAYALGPYGSAYSAAGASGNDSIAYSGEPLPGNPSQYVDYLVAPDEDMGGANGADVTRPLFAADPVKGAADQMGYDAQWISYAHAMQQQGGVDAASIQAA